MTHEIIRGIIAILSCDACDFVANICYYVDDVICLTKLGYECIQSLDGRFHRRSGSDNGKRPFRWNVRHDLFKNPLIGATTKIPGNKAVAQRRLEA